MLVCPKDIADLAFKAVALLVAIISASFALVTYRYNARTKAADFLVALHKTFFIEARFNELRSRLDDASEAGLANIDAEVKAESEPLTDFLNFFELVAYMQKRSTLSMEAVEALLGYYLNILSGNVSLRTYISNRAKGFEQLDDLLTKREAKPSSEK